MEGVTSAESVLDIINTNTANALQITKEDTLTYDLGNLTAFDYAPINVKDLRQDPEGYLRSTSRENLQLLLQKIYQLEIERPPADVNGALVLLPEPSTPIPREKRIPTPKAPTPWETFAQQKGIKKRKRDRMVVDDNTGLLRPTYGANRANNDNEVWVVEDKPNRDKTYEDPFEEMDAMKKGRVEKQRKQELKNFGRQQKAQGQRPSFNSQPAKKQKLNNNKSASGEGEAPAPHPREIRKNQLQHSFDVAAKSTISMGKFGKKLKGEKPVREKQKPLAKSSERTDTMKILNRVLGSDGKVNAAKAANKYIAEEQRKNSQQRGQKGGKRKRS